MSDRNHPYSRLYQKSKSGSGFSMIELMVAMGVFLVIGGAAVSLFRQNTRVYVDQQGTTTLNITMRNALAQIQTDVVNAANGYYSTLNSTAGWPLGITATNVNPGYDTLNVIVPATAPSSLPAGTCVDTTSGTALITPPAGVTAGSFPAGNEVLFLNSTGNQFTTGMLTGAVTAGTNITLQFQKTGTAIGLGGNTPANDPLGVTTQALPANYTDQLSNTFCQATGGSVVLLGKTTYTVNGTNQLTRQVGGGAAEQIADQIIGFKVGVSQFTTAAGTSGQYFYDNSYYSRSIRSVRVSVIGRTNPNQWSGSNFTNSFDGGNYKIEALSLVINPRNLSMNDCGSCN